MDKVNIGSGHYSSISQRDSLGTQMHSKLLKELRRDQPSKNTQKKPDFFKTKKQRKIHRKENENSRKREKLKGNFEINKFLKHEIIISAILQIQMRK
jgi:hypothetical protein